MGTLIGRRRTLEGGTSAGEVSGGVSVVFEVVAGPAGAKGARTACNLSTSGRGGATRTKMVCPGVDENVPSASMADFKGAGS